MITNLKLNSKILWGAFALALTASAFAQETEVATKPAAKKKAVYAQQTFSYVEKSMFSTNTLKLEVLSTEPVVWNGKVIIINHGSAGRGQPQRVDADHRSHSRNQAPQSPASSLGHITVTEDVQRRNSMRISGVATTTTGLDTTGSDSVLKVTGTNACG